MRRVVARAVGDVAVTFSVVLFLFALWQGWWTDVKANGQASAELAVVQADFANSAGSSGAVTDQRGVAAVMDPEPALYAHDEAIGVVHLPTLGEVRVVKEGVDANVINQGVLGHYPDTAAPGQVGNFAVAGHRTTYGRPLWNLDKLQAGDPIVVETAAGYHIYRLERLEVVPPERWQVLAPVPGVPDAAATSASMVLTACHPKFSAAQRLVGFAVLERSVPRSEGLPFELSASALAGGR